MNKFAFLIHPRYSIAEDMGRVNPIFKIFPEILLRSVIRYLPPIVAGKVRINKGAVQGYIIVIPIVGDQFFSLSREFVIKKIQAAIIKAEKLGVSVVGLGEFVSSISHGGIDLIGSTRLTITNGNALTAGISFESVRRVINNKFNKEKLVIGIVGAAGSIGSAVAKMLAQENYNLLLNDKNSTRLSGVIDQIKSRCLNLKTKRADRLIDLKSADVVVVASSATELIIKSEHLKTGAILYDITQPRNVSPKLIMERPDLKVIDGGVIDTPHIDYGMNIGLSPHQAFACLAETMIFAMEDIKENSVGFVEVEKAKKMISLMNKNPHFKTNFYSFGRRL